MNSKKNTVSPIAPMSLVTIMLSAIFFVATVFGQLEQAQAQEDAQFVTGAVETIGWVQSLEQAQAQEDTQFVMGAIETIGWVQSLEEAVAQSQNTGKPVMLVFSGSDWCSYCQLLEHEVFRTPEFESWSSDRVIKVMIDFPQHQSQSAEVVQRNQQLKQHYSEYLKGYPTVLMIEPTTGSVIGRTGYVAGGPQPWISKAESILPQPAHHMAVSSTYQNH